jgi:zinc transport system substrate-binding protein
VFRVLLFALAWPFLAASSTASAQVLQVQVSIEPLQYLVERVGGEHVDVGVVVRAGQAPETYEPTPRQIAALAEAAVFFGVGMPLEASWYRQLGGDAALQPEWVDLGVELVESNGGYDPHVWLSPVNAQHMVSTIRRALSGLSPEHAESFDANATDLHDELELLHGDITAVLKESGVETFLVFHPAWGHFARAYGLEQLAVESDGKEPGPRALIEVIRRARQERIQTLFLDPRHNTRLAGTIAEAIDGEIKMLDPLSYDYINNLRSAAQAIATSQSS